MGREFELKYQATPETIAAIQAKFGEFTPISMETTYFDTEDLALRKRKWTLRRRLEVFVNYARTVRKQFGGLSGDLAGWFLQRAEFWMLAALVLCQYGEKLL